MRLLLKIKSIIFKILALIFSLVIVLMICEGAIFILFKSGKIRLIEDEKLTHLTQIPPSISNPKNLVYVPHPYFGYVYFLVYY